MKQKQPPTQPSIVTILINWNAFKDTEECIQSLLKADYPANSIVIVDNASTDDSLARLKEEFGSRVHFIENKKNLGFTGANNKGFGYALKNGFDYVFVLNNDTVVDKNIFKEFISCFADDSKGTLGILSPKIYNYYNPTVIESKGGILDILRSRNYPICFGEKETKESAKSELPYEITFATGSAMFIKSGVLKKIGFFDNGYFAYYEDQDFCCKAVKDGFRILYCPGARVWHKVSASTGGYKNPIALSLSTRNRIRFVLKNGSGLQKTGFFLYFLLYYTPVFSVWMLLNRDFLRLEAFLKGLWSYMGSAGAFDFSTIEPVDKGFLRIGINARYAQRQITGIERYTVELIKHIGKIDTKDRFTLFFNKHEPVPNLSDNPHFSSYVSRFPTRSTPMRILWDELILYFEIVKNRIDVFHGPSFVVPVLKPKSCRYIITVHHLSWLYYPERFTFFNRLVFTFFLPRSIRNADKIIADSYATKKDIIKFFKVPSKKIKVIYLGIDDGLYTLKKDREDQEKRTEVLHKYNLPDKYILSIGSLLPRKNVVNIIRAFHELRKKGREEKLVIIGKKAWLYEQIFNVIKQFNLKDDVIFTGYVDDKDLPCLYGSARLLLFPSLYEGFGLPILEAMASGCPVITSNVSSMPEVAGDAALLVNPNSVREITEATKLIMTDKRQRENLIEKGYDQVKKFSWEKTARETLITYTALK